MGAHTVTEATFAARDGCLLSGTIVVPDREGPHPAALLLSGSGPLDRDSNMEGQILGISWAVAEMLADAGIASLRYDKRGVGRSEGDYFETGFETETSDAFSARQFLCGATAVDSARVGTIGHSVGATIALRKAAVDPSVAFTVLLAVASSPGREVVEWQSGRIAASLPGPDWLLGRWFRSRQQRDRERLLASTEDVIWLRRQRTPAKWLREYMAHDPGLELAAIRTPVLAVTGAKDLQIDPAELAVIGDQVQGPCQTESPHDLTHVLRSEPGKPKLSDYPDLIVRPVDAELLQLLTAWIRATIGAPNG
ncbi:MAG: alpha/beta hydrolase [bacterium]|nr:alpha/beta hydrolase [bacterium]